MATEAVSEAIVLLAFMILSGSISYYLLFVNGQGSLFGQQSIAISLIDIQKTLADMNKSIQEHNANKKDWTVVDKDENIVTKE